MLDRTEIERIRQEGLGSILPRAKWDFTIDLGRNPDEVWSRIVGVAESIVAFHSDNWPNDQYWNAKLPPWLSSSMMTLEEARAVMARTPREQWDKLSWELGSWLDAMRERGWKWWGYKRSGNHIRLVLEIVDFPPRIDAFKQILFASGASILSEDYD
jgi:hypothetical protein